MGKIRISGRMENSHSDFFDATCLNLDGTVFRLPIFTNFVISQYYWTSTTDAANISEPWTVFSCDFGVYDIPKTNIGYTLAIRQAGNAAPFARLDVTSPGG
jgi:hypothetical protein